MSRDFPTPPLRARRRSSSFRGLGQVPITRDVVNALPMPIEPEAGEYRPRRDLPIWLYPPVNWENIDVANYANLPAIGATATIVSFTVPIGRNGIVNKIANNFVGGGWTEGSGAVIWRILVDGTPPPGATSYDNIVNSLGSPAQPTGIAGFRIFENQVITVVIQNVSVILAGQLAGARLLGYFYPRHLEEPDIWI